MRVWKDFRFEAGHHLPNVPAAHKCGRPHGHSYRFRLEIEGRVDPTLGWVVDYGGLVKAAGDLICDALDHRCLNDIEGLANPTAEHLAIWIFDRVAVTQLGGGVGEYRLVAVEVQETHTAGVRYEPEARWG